MKISNVRRKRGNAFTLVELLVVIAIISILIAVIGVSVAAAIRYAKRTKSSATAVQIQTAVQNYNVEYGVYPTEANYPATGDAYYSGTAASLGGWKDITYCLCGNVNPYTGAAAAGMPNTRAIAFLSPSHSDVDLNGVLVNPFGLNGASGSTYYYMALDTDYTGVTGDNGDAAGKLPVFTPGPNVNFAGQPVTGGAAVWSPNDQKTAGVSPASNWSHTY